MEKARSYIQKQIIVMQKTQYNIRYSCNVHINVADILIQFGEMC